MPHFIQQSLIYFSTCTRLTLGPTITASSYCRTSRINTDFFFLLHSGKDRSLHILLKQSNSLTVNRFPTSPPVLLSVLTHLPGRFGTCQNTFFHPAILRRLCNIQNTTEGPFCNSEPHNIYYNVYIGLPQLSKTNK